MSAAAATSPAAVEARAACRVDCAGGTLDIWPLGLLHPGAGTVAFAIDIEARVRLAPRARGYRVTQGAEAVEADDLDELSRHPDGALAGLVLVALEAPPAEVALASDSPRGGGLGASSAMAVALIAAAEAFVGRDASGPATWTALARDLEARLMGLPTGTQDHWAAVLGGALAMSHRPGGSEVRRLDADLGALGDALVVVYTGATHFSAANNWQVIRRRLDGDADIVRLFDGIAAAAGEAAEALEAGDLPRLGALMSAEWSLRRRLASEVSTPGIERLLAAAAAAGAWGGKACGAGGGGCLAVLAPPERRTAVAEALTAAGGRVLAARPTAEPLRLRTGVGAAAAASPS
jgi:D-glycero-alpha-D-manno-heptose-7-phosphate kinase